MAFARVKTRLGLSGLLAALAVELADELVDGTKSAAMPLIRHDLALNYLQIGMLAAVPLVVGSVLELPAGVIAGTGSRRRRFILAGGLVFVASVLAAGLATSFLGLLAALTVFFPASGLFVSLTQAALMDSAPGRRAQYMARWTLAGSVGPWPGPFWSPQSLALAAAGGWRSSSSLASAWQPGAPWRGPGPTQPQSSTTTPASDRGLAGDQPSRSFAAPGQCTGWCYSRSRT